MSFGTWGWTLVCKDMPLLQWHILCFILDVASGRLDPPLLCEMLISYSPEAPTLVQVDK